MRLSEYPADEFPYKYEYPEVLLGLRDFGRGLLLRLVIPRLNSSLDEAKRQGRQAVSNHTAVGTINRSAYSYNTYLDACLELAGISPFL